MIRLTFLAPLLISVTLVSDGAAQPQPKKGPPIPTPKPASARTKLLSELAPPKAGEKVQVMRADVTAKLDDGGLMEVTDITPGVEKGATIASTTWELDVDGWFDAEGFNVAKAYPRSGLWAMRGTKGNRPPVNPFGQAASPTTLPPRLYRSGPGDIITHVDGIAVTSYARFVYAINNATNPRDLAIVVMDVGTGRKHLYYVTAVKEAIQ